MKKLTIVVIVILMIPIRCTYAQKVDSLKIHPISPGLTDSVEVTVYGVLTSGGVTITRVEHNSDWSSNSILVSIYGRHCGGAAVVTPFEHVHVFPPMMIGTLNVCCSTFMDTNSISGPNGDCDLSDTLIPLWHICESYLVVNTTNQVITQGSINIIGNPIRDRMLRLRVTDEYFSKTFMISMFDLTGRIVYKEPVNITGTYTELFINSVNQGIYILTIEDGVRQVLTQKMICFR